MALDTMDVVGCNWCFERFYLLTCVEQVKQHSKHPFRGEVAVQAEVRLIYENVAKQALISCRHCGRSTSWPSLTGWFCNVFFAMHLK